LGEGTKTATNLAEASKTVTVMEELVSELGLIVPFIPGASAIPSPGVIGLFATVLTEV